MSTANTSSIARERRTVHPTVRQIGMADLMDAIAKGFADFNAMPTHFFYLAIIYPIVTFAVAGFYGELDLLPFIFPLLAGYTLLGPLAAIGTYELSRRREFGRFTSRTNAFLVFKSHSINAIVNLGVVLMIIYFAWLFAAQAIYVQHFGEAAPESYMGFVNQLFTTQQGTSMIIVGCGIGFLFAVVVLSFSVVSFPMLLDLDVGVLLAIKTSVKAVIANPVTMAVWGVIVAASLLLGSLPFFVGLCVVLPVIGHATWHLYRKVVES
ncbi:MAG: hypothetical protein CMM10_07200 [Rhodospirillaceae bacterium]|jgi:uncharacterized membrane protein|nr:hypothetical protein [Rhodospirillaceae bacterium]|tara:strand:- start:555 stop:1352 length:798 start_codon:yes stop_codon:yes gene_type:complete